MHTVASVSYCNLYQLLNYIEDKISSESCDDDTNVKKKKRSHYFLVVLLLTIRLATIFYNIHVLMPVSEGSSKVKYMIFYVFFL